MGGLEKRKDVVRIVLQSGPLRLRAGKAEVVGTLCCQSSDVILETVYYYNYDF